MPLKGCPQHLDLVHFPERWALEMEQHLPQYLLRQRWFGGKARTIRQVRLVDSLILPPCPAAEGTTSGSQSAFLHRSKPQGNANGSSSATEKTGIVARDGEQVFWLFILAVNYSDGCREFYTLPVTVLPASLETSAENVILRWSQPDNEAMIVDTTRWPEFWLALVALLTRQVPIMGTAAQDQKVPWSVAHTRGFTLAQAGPFALIDVAIFTGEQSQSLAVLRQTVVVKLFRRLEPGINPDWEICRFLTEEQPFPHIPTALAALEYDMAELLPTELQAEVSAEVGSLGQVTTLAMMTSYRPNRGDAWTCLLAELATACDHVLAEIDRVGVWPPEKYRKPVGSEDLLSLLLQLAMGDRPEESFSKAPDGERSIAAAGSYTARMGLLGQRTAELHLALAKSQHPSFAPEPIDLNWQRTIAEQCSRQVREALALLRQRLSELPPSVALLADRLLQREERLLTRTSELGQRPLQGQRIRIHGDYHLGQVLCTEDDFVILDFEGEPARPLAERRAKHCPLRDVAGMFRSFHYAVASTWRSLPSNLSNVQRERIGRWLREWYVETSASFLRGYLQTPRITSLLPTRTADVHLLLSVFLLEKAAYELAYELNHRPDWVEIPLQGLLELVGDTRPLLSVP